MSYSGCLLQTPSWVSHLNRGHFTWVCSMKCLGKGLQPHCMRGFKLYGRKLHVEKLLAITVAWLPAFPQCKSRARNCCAAVADATSVIPMQSNSQQSWSMFPWQTKLEGCTALQHVSSGMLQHSLGMHPAHLLLARSIAVKLERE